jgi:hypothetical protein
MKLWVVIGGAEYLLRGLTPQTILPVIKSFDPTAQLPGARWLSGAPDASLHHELFRANSEEVISLFLESLEESYTADDNVYVPLCFETSDQFSSGAHAKLRDSRSQAFLDLALLKLGPAVVRCVRFYLSPRTDAVLQALQVRMTAAGLNDAGPERPSRIFHVPVVNVELESRQLPAPVQETVWANYQESVLRRMGALLAARLPFDPVSFGKLFARRSREAGLELRRDLGPSDVIDSLDGEKLLSAVALL